MNDQRELFDAARTVPQACPVGHCQAIRLPDQDKVPTCVHDLGGEGTRPRGCLNTVDPADTPIPY